MTNDASMFRVDRMVTPLDPILLVTDGEGRLRALEFEDGADRLRRLMTRYYRHVPSQTGDAPAYVRRKLKDYFEGDLGAIQAIETACGGTEFQRRVWMALRDIPAGTTESYGTLALRIGQPKAVRAVGLANGANPIGVVVPCHRVIGTDGTLTGYGGGISRKRWLLQHEGAAFREARPPSVETRLPGL